MTLGSGYRKLWFSSAVTNLGDGVGGIAYVWLASAVTRNPVLIALIAVAQRIPWLVFTLPAGVLTDRWDRRRIMVVMDVLRTGLTLFVAGAVLAGEGRLVSPAELAAGAQVPTDAGLYTVLVTTALLFGFAEVLRDNAAQTILPSLVPAESLETANARLWGAEMVMNSFVGPALGGLLLGVGFVVPFVFDAGTFAVAAALLFSIPGAYRAASADTGSIAWRTEIAAGVRWLWDHRLLRSLAIILGLMNGLTMMAMAAYVLFAQEVLDLDTGFSTGVLRDLGVENVGALVFALLTTSGAIGGLLGMALAGRVSRRLGTGPSLLMAIGTGMVAMTAIGAASTWPVVWLMMVLFTFTGLVWNVITVSLRQTIIPDELLGRVNSVYRMLGWGMLPLGAALGGGLVAVAEQVTSRSTALRVPFFAAAAVYAGILVFAVSRLTTARIEAARAEAGAAS